nr:DUF6065 family protein [Motilibacter aurantiacus]
MVAYFGKGGPARAPIVPAPRKREWLDFTPGRSGKYCLPLLMAGEQGWEICNPVGFTAVWDGGEAPDALTVVPDGRPREVLAASIFGGGVLSFGVPHVFRTPSGWNLLVRGPANRPKDAVSPLEGLVETDWSVAPFTMNWKLTRPGAQVRFEEGEPFAMILPQARGTLAEFEPRWLPRSADPYTSQEAARFHEERVAAHRQNFLAANGFGEPAPLGMKYFKGQYPDGSPAPVHETRTRLREFEPWQGPADDVDGA